MNTVSHQICEMTKKEKNPKTTKLQSCEGEKGVKPNPPVYKKQMPGRKRNLKNIQLLQTLAETSEALLNTTVEPKSINTGFPRNKGKHEEKKTDKINHRSMSEPDKFNNESLEKETCDFGTATQSNEQNVVNKNQNKRLDSNHNTSRRLCCKYKNPSLIEDGKMVLKSHHPEGEENSSNINMPGNLKMRVKKKLYRVKGQVEPQNGQLMPAKDESTQGSVMLEPNTELPKKIKEDTVQHLKSDNIKKTNVKRRVYKRSKVPNLITKKKLKLDCDLNLVQNGNTFGQQELKQAEMLGLNSINVEPSQVIHSTRSVIKSIVKEQTNTITKNYSPNLLPKKEDLHEQDQMNAAECPTDNKKKRRRKWNLNTIVDWKKKKRKVNSSGCVNPPVNPEGNVANDIKEHKELVLKLVRLEDLPLTKLPTLGSKLKSDEYCATDMDIKGNKNVENVQRISFSTGENISCNSSRTKMLKNTMKSDEIETLNCGSTIDSSTIDFKAIPKGEHNVITDISVSNLSQRDSKQADENGCSNKFIAMNKLTRYSSKCKESIQNSKDEREGNTVESYMLLKDIENTSSNADTFNINEFNRYCDLLETCTKNKQVGIPEIEKEMHQKHAVNNNTCCNGKTYCKQKVDLQNDPNSKTISSGANLSTNSTGDDAVEDSLTTLATGTQTANSFSEPEAKLHCCRICFKEFPTQRSLSAHFGYHARRRRRGYITKYAAKRKSTAKSNNKNLENSQTKNNDNKENNEAPLNTKSATNHNLQGFQKNNCNSDQCTSTKVINGDASSKNISAVKKEECGKDKREETAPTAHQIIMPPGDNYSLPSDHITINSEDISALQDSEAPDSECSQSMLNVNSVEQDSALINCNENYGSIEIHNVNYKIYNGLQDESLEENIEANNTALTENNPEFDPVSSTEDEETDTEAEDSNELDSEAYFECNENPNNDAPELVRKWHCDLCNEKFALIRNFLRHKYYKHQDESAVHICDNCTKVLTSVAMVNIHVCTNVTSWTCKRCNISFENSLSLTQHNMQRHLETVGPHKCDMCQSSFLTMYMLERHKSQQHPVSQSHVFNFLSFLKDKKLPWFPTENDYTKNNITSESDSLCHVLKKQETLRRSTEEAIEKLNLQNVLVLPNSEDSLFNKAEKFAITFRMCNGEEQFGCNLCSINYMTKSEMKLHLMEQHNISIRTCELCGDLYIPSRVVNHLIERHIVFDNFSLMEGRCCTFRSNLTQIHSNQLDLQKILGQKRFASLQKYREFYKRRKSKYIHCTECSEDYLSMDGYIFHELKVHDVSCILCNVEFEDNSQALYHKTETHKSIAAYLWAIQKLIRATIIAERHASMLSNIVQEFQMINLNENNEESDCLEEPTETSNINIQFIGDSELEYLHSIIRMFESVNADQEACCNNAENNTIVPSSQDSSNVTTSNATDLNTVDEVVDSQWTEASVDNEEVSIVLVTDTDLETYKNNLKVLGSQIYSSCKVYSEEYFTTLLFEYIQNSETQTHK